MQASVALRNTEDGLIFGSLEDIGEDVLLIRAMFPWNPSTEVDFRLELTERGGWVSGRLFIVGFDEEDIDTAPVARCRIAYMDPEERKRLDDWLEERSEGGTSRHPSRWVDDLSQVSDVATNRKRAAFREALRDRVRKLRTQRAEQSLRPTVDPDYEQ
jgi:hypothetical protein